MRFQFLTLLGAIASVAATTPLMDSNGALRLKIPELSTRQGVVSIVSSPGTSSLFVDSDDLLALESENPPCLVCRGATLSGTSNVERTALAASSLVSGAILVDGITAGDVEAGWKNSRHARTLTALFRARIAIGSSAKQSLILCVRDQIDASTTESLVAEVKAVFDATAVETEMKPSFSDLYDVDVLSVTTDSEAKEVLELAKKTAAENVGEDSTLATVLEEANERVKESGVVSVALDPPHIAQAFVAVGSAHAKFARAARSKFATWKSRSARGLLVDSFGPEAEALRSRILGGFDSETLAAAGLPLVSAYRMEMRTQLVELIDSTISEIFETQVTVLKKAAVKKLRSQLLKSLDSNSPDQESITLNSVSSFFAAKIQELEVPSLALSRSKAISDMDSVLADELAGFPDSPAAQIKRTDKVTSVTNKQKKPGQRSIDFGLDLVAMLRPDGFGSLQGFAGYQLGGNSVTFGIHNDADDPQTIAQFGGVRPPLLRIQPKLRVDVEM